MLDLGLGAVPGAAWGFVPLLLFTLLYSFPLLRVEFDHAPLFTVTDFLGFEDCSVGCRNKQI